MDRITARLLIGLLIDALIANGYLLPEQRDQWINGIIQLSGSVGALLLVLQWHHNAHTSDNDPTKPINIAGIVQRVKAFALIRKSGDAGVQ